MTVGTEGGHLRLPNWLVERLARLHLTATQWQVIWAVWRETLCWQKGTHWGNRPYGISTLDLVTATGLNERVVKRDMSKLVEMNIILREKTVGGRWRKTVTSFNLDPSTWEIKGDRIDTLSDQVNGDRTDTLSDTKMTPFMTKNDTLSMPNSGALNKGVNKGVNKGTISAVFDRWNSLGMVKHKTFTDKMRAAIKRALKN